MKIYALLVGINNYQKVKPNLTGCVPDILRFEAYLKESLNVPDGQILKLTDTEATKNAIVAGFQTHLAQATYEDAVIFYFSGHGVRQIANPVFKADAINDTIESMTCYDTAVNGINLITDKDLRWLIRQLEVQTKGSHILTIFDCCHSGDNTRDTSKAKSIARLAEYDAKGGDFFPQNPWNEFVFSKTISEQQVTEALKNGEKLDAIFPQGSHIQLAACGSNETAKEPISGERGGYFSKYLLKLLKSSNGKMSYYDLRSLIYRHLESQLRPEDKQTPQFYAVNSSLFQPFLGGDFQDTVQANVQFNDKKGRWEMTIGSIYGIYKGATVFVTLPHKNNEVEAAIVQDVYPECSVLTFKIEGIEWNKNIPDGGKRIRRTDTYKADVGKFIQKDIKIACIDPKLATAWAAFCKKRAASLGNSSIKLTENTAAADYVLNTEGGYLFIARPNYPARPLVKMLPNAGSDASFDSVVEQLAAVSRWEFVRTQKSVPEAQSLFDNLSINFTYTGQEEKLDTVDKKTCAVTHATQDGEDTDLYWIDENFAITIVNNHPTDTLYIAAIWLSEVFGMDSTAFMKSPMPVPLEPTKSGYIYDPQFQLALQPHIFADKWDKLSNFLKIYVSKQPFEITQLNQADMESPHRKMPVQEQTKDRFTRPASSLALTVPQWAVKTIEFELDLAALRI
jgi:hypothetical protein